MNRDTLKTKDKPFRLAPSQSIIAGFALMIFVGALLLNLPIASKSGEGVGFLDALFTAASASCVNGLTVVNTMEHWTWFGKTVLLVLTQFGALGLVTILTAAMLLTQHHITLRNRQAIQASFNQESIGGIDKFVKNVVLITVAFEFAGALLLAVCFRADASMAGWESVYQGVFHSISAFCNAGFDNLGVDSLIKFRNNAPINFIIIILTVAGGLGFPVLIETGRFLKNPHKRSLRQRLIHLSLHAKIVYVITGALILTGTALFLLFEWYNPDTLGDLPLFQKLQAALFQSVMLRTTGFSTISQNGLAEESQFVSCVLMIIGGSSAGTAGGVKTITVGVLFFSMVSLLKGRANLEAFGRSLPLDLLQKSLTVVSTMCVVVFTTVILLCLSEQTNPFQHTFLDLLFETCSAAGTVGMNIGITPHLSPAGKIILIVCMYLGRLSPAAVVIALNARLHNNAGGISYPEERVIIG